MLKEEKVKKDKQKLIFVSVILFLALSCALVVNGVVNNTQSAWAIVPDIRLVGEYKIGDGEWKPIVEGEHISATKGAVAVQVPAGFLPFLHDLLDKGLSHSFLPP